MKTFVTVWTILATSVFVGCAGNAPISRSQCDVGDWQTIGHRDGALGKRSSALLELQEFCTQYGVTPDRETYQLGWREGVREYCAPSNGFSLGDAGQTHQNVCPEDLRAAFADAYQEGRVLHLTRQRIVDLETEIAEGTERLETVRTEIISTTAAQLNPLLTPTRRAELVAEVQGLNDERVRLKALLPELEEDRVSEERALAELERGALR